MTAKLQEAEQEARDVRRQLELVQQELQRANDRAREDHVSLDAQLTEVPVFLCLEKFF